MNGNDNESGLKASFLLQTQATNTNTHTHTHIYTNQSSPFISMPYHRGENNDRQSKWYGARNLNVEE